MGNARTEDAWQGRRRRRPSAARRHLSLHTTFVFVGKTAFWISAHTSTEIKDRHAIALRERPDLARKRDCGRPPRGARRGRQSSLSSPPQKAFCPGLSRFPPARLACSSTASTSSGSLAMYARVTPRKPSPPALTIRSSASSCQPYKASQVPLSEKKAILGALSSRRGQPSPCW